MSDDLLQKLLAIFRPEAREHLEHIRRHLDALRDKDDPRGHDLDEAFRRAHSLKGAARAVNLAPIETLAHRLETLFSRLREGASGALTPALVQTMDAVLNTIEDWLDAHQKGRPAPSIDDALQTIDALLAGSENTSVPPAVPAPVPVPIAAPPVENAAARVDESVRINASRLERLRRFSGELLAEGMRQESVGRHMREAGAAVALLEKSWESVRRRGHSAVGPDRTAHALDSFEAHLRALKRLMGSTQKAQRQTSWVFRRLGGQLHEEVHHLLKIPAESLYQGLRKMTRDLARDEGKEIDVHVAGLDTEADRRVLQALKDPLMHLLRNAVNHGVETPRERLAAGKKNPARIALTLETIGNRLHIRVEDDGRGLDFKKIAETAVRQGILSGEAAEQTADSDLEKILFHPGFSTASQVTDVSGRGMGLSVVLEEALRLQGDIRIENRPGAGTAFILSVPLTSASRRLLLIRTQDQTLAIPVHAIERLLRIRAGDVTRIKGGPVITVDETPVPLFSLAHLLKMGDTSLHLDGEQIPVLILKDSTQRLALAVDGFVGELEGVVADLGAPLAGLRLLAGGIVMGDGSVVCVLNAAELLRLREEQTAAPLLTVQKKLPAKKAPQVLVVDDSITTRTLEKSILEAHGYRVLLAVDGIDALDMLKRHSVDLVIVDVQMPRMDGFTFVEAMKAEPAFAKIPVIMVTSLEEKKDKEKGLAVGVDAYIVKGKFDHQNLLETIRQIL